MKQGWGTIGCIIAATALTVGAAPYIGYVYPASAQQGTTVRLLVGGQGMNGVKFGLVSGQGVKIRDVEVVPNFPNAARSQKQWLMASLEALEKGKATGVALPSEKERADWRTNPWWEHLAELDDFQRNLVLRDLLEVRNALQKAPSIQQKAIVTLEIAADAEPGMREIRVWAPNAGISVPRRFLVTAAPHQCEPRYIAKSRPQPPATVTNMPVVLDGQILPGEVDRFKITLKKGVSYCFKAYARTLLPFIGDAVPGHFQAVLRMLDAEGNELAFVDDWYFNPDPILFFTPESDGPYTLEVRDNLFRGREDFVYTVAVEEKKPEIEQFENPFPHLAQVTVAEAEHKPVTADAECCLHGVLERPDSVGTFYITGKAGQAVALEVVARQIGSPVDGFMRLYAPDGGKIAESEGQPSLLHIGEYVQYVDPYIALELPVSGTYKVVFSERTQKGGKDYQYWIRIGKPQPDFTVYSSLSAINFSADGWARVKFYVDRKNGFTNDVRIVSEDIAIDDPMIRTNLTDKVVVFHRKDALPAHPVPTKIYAEAQVNGQTIRRQVIPAEEMMQAFAYNHLVPAESFYMMQYRFSGKKAARKKK